VNKSLRNRLGIEYLAEGKGRIENMGNCMAGIVGRKKGRKVKKWKVFFFSS